MLKVLYTVNIKMWYHPKYYKELRKRNKLDQAISKEPATAGNQRSPGPGPKASSSKPQAASVKLQAASNKLPDTFSLIKFYRDRSQGLY